MNRHGMRVLKARNSLLHAEECAQKSRWEGCTESSFLHPV